jgi:hypothetical protein
VPEKSTVEGRRRKAERTLGLGIRKAATDDYYHRQLHGGFNRPLLGRPMFACDGSEADGSDLTTGFRIAMAAIERAWQSADRPDLREAGSPIHGRVIWPPAPEGKPFLGLDGLFWIYIDPDRVIFEYEETRVFVRLWPPSLAVA